MAASVEVTGLAAFSKSLSKAVNGGIQRQIVNDLHTAGPKVVSDMHRAANTRIQSRAMATVVVSNTSTGIEISGGRGGGLGAELFDGAEYGGRESKKGAGRRHVPYQTHSRTGRAYFVMRRTTMQFLPYISNDGYIFWPAVRRMLDATEKRQKALVAKAIGGTR